MTESSWADDQVSPTGPPPASETPAGFPRLSPGELAKFRRILQVYTIIARRQGAAERDASPHPRPYYIQERIDFWGSVVQVCNHVDSILSMITVEG